jgi:predicted ATP-grasp superfamily ATP-dependent carboligase
MDVEVLGHPLCLSALSRSACYAGFRQDCYLRGRPEEFLRFLQGRNYDAMLPVGAGSVQRAGDLRGGIGQYTRLALPPRAGLDTAFSETATQQTARQAGVRCPRTWSPRSIDELPRIVDDAEFPLVIKRASEMHPGRPIYVQTRAAAVEAVQQWYRRFHVMPVLEEYIDGGAEGFFALYDRGACKRIFMHRRIRQTPPTGGASCCAESIWSDDLKSAGMAILDALCWHGPAMVEFKRERQSGELVVMEVNPKFWGSLDLAIASGVNFPALAARIAMGEEIGVSETYRIGTRFHWPLDGGEIHHLLAAPRAIRDVMRDCLDRRVRSNLSLRDPLPGLYSLARGIGDGIRTVFR